MVERLGWTLVHFVWEGALVAGLLALVLLATRRVASNLRYGLALSALVVLAALPFATFLALVPKSGAIALSGAPHWASGETLPGRGASTVGPMPLLVGVWSVGVVLLSLRLVGTLLHLERWRRHYARPADPEAQARLDALARRLGLRRRVALFLSDRLEVPSAWGVVRPVVVLPASLLLGLAPAQAEAVILHELAHIRRHDYLVNLLQSVVETALFYHPAVWWVSSVVRREREHVCDDLVVDALGDPAPYARALLLLEERRRAPRPALSAKEGKLMDRIARILAPRPAPVRLSPLAPALAALAVVGLALGGVLRAEAQAKPALKRPIIVTPGTATAKAESRATRAQGEALAAQRRALVRALETSQTSKGRADAARQRAQRVQIKALESQLQTLQDQERALLDAQRRSGATYGTPGKGQAPIWKAQNYPQGVGRLVDPKAQDARAFAEAEAALVRAQSLARSARAAEEVAAAQKAADDVVAQRLAARRTADVATAQSIAALEARKDLPDARRRVLELYWKAQGASVEATRKAATLQVQASLDQARAEMARAQATLEGQRKDARGPKAFDDAASVRSLFAMPPRPGTGAKRAESDGYRRLFDFQQSGAFSLPKGSPLFPAAATAPTVEFNPRDQSVSIDADRASFASTMRALAKKAKIRMAIEMGSYYDVTVVLDDISAERALEILCKAGHATFRREGGVYYILPKPVEGTFGGGGLGGSPR